MKASVRKIFAALPTPRPEFEVNAPTFEDERNGVRRAVWVFANGSTHTGFYRPELIFYGGAR